MLDELKTALAATGYDFAHHAWSKAPTGDYGVYAEDGEQTIWADGHRRDFSLTGTVDYFTRDDSKTPRETIEAALNGIDIAWYLNSIQYESDTGYIHYEWVFEVA